MNPAPSSPVAGQPGHDDAGQRPDAAPAAAVPLAAQLAVIDQHIYEARTAVRLLPQKKFGPGVAAAIDIYRRDLDALVAVRATVLAFARLAELVERGPGDRVATSFADDVAALLAVRATTGAAAGEAG